MKYTALRSAFRYFSLFLLVVYCSCSEENMNNPPNELSQLTGTLVFPHAGEIFTYDLASQNIAFLADRKGRQGPFFSPDGSFFTTNNWPGNNEGVAVWEVNNGSIKQEFNLSSTLISDEKGVKIAPGGVFFSGVVNVSGQNPDLIVLDEQGNSKWKIDGDGLRIKGHAWDAQRNLFFTGEVLQGSGAGTLILAKVADLQDPKLKIVRTFTGEFQNLPDELSISPDGSRIVYSYETNIWVGSTAEGATDHRTCFEAVQSLARPVFSPEGTYVALAMKNSNTSSRGDIHIAKIPSSGATQLEPEGPSKLPGPNSSSKSTWTGGNDSSIGWFK